MSDQIVTPEVQERYIKLMSSLYGPAWEEWFKSADPKHRHADCARVTADLRNAAASLRVLADRLDKGL